MESQRPWRTRVTVIANWDAEQLTADANTAMGELEATGAVILTVGFAASRTDEYETLAVCITYREPVDAEGEDRP